ncbi:capsule biosynthesis protein [Alistipes sp. Z76]|nr:capsule biosynthesis protein [Alistipes sp. Z76]NCE68314.1 capsule biosynthesis protein [Muribaculaceae bacterium M3]
MRRAVMLLFLLAAPVMAARAQSNQELLEAYRNGTLTQSQIDELKAKNADKTKEDNSTQKDRRRSVNAATANGVNVGQADVNADVRSGLPTDPQEGLVEGIGLGDRRDSIATIAKAPRRIFGHDLFTNSRLTFEPNLSIATPDNYVLGPGDEVIIDVWGDSQMTIEATVSPDGKIFVSNVGPVTLAGLAISEAAQRLRGSLAAIYEGLYDGSVKMKLSLGSIRSIQVNVAGEVASSGTYTLPSLATLFHALHMAGGVEQLGTLRSIKVYRGGKLFSDVDVYDYILNGKTDKDIALRDGDLVTVAAYGKLAEVSGEVKRPMFYEMKGSETIGDLVRFAGGFTNDANRKMVSVTRRQGGEYRSFTVDSGDFDTFVLEDGDVVSVAGAIDRYENRVEVKGAVYREGYYAIDDKVNTVKELIARADGLRDDAFRSRALLYREKPDWTMEVQAIDLDGLMAGRVADISLRPNDILMIPAVSEMQEQYDVTIFGSVSRPDTYPYAENMTVEDLVIAAGGLLESASTANVIVTRRVKDPRSTRVSDTLFETFTVNISDALSTDGEGGFVLKPFDQVYVRRSPVYITQSSVTVRGEVTFEGTYPLSHRNMRISEIIGSAGNVTPGAFVEGAYLLRKMTDEERAQRRALREMIEAQAERGDKDSLNMAGVELSTVYSVGIDLEKALAAPGSDADIVLRDGDVISVPTYNGTVRVMGAVLYPNSVTYRAGKKMKYYVNAAGGYDNRARKNRAFVIYMNGMVASGTSAEIRPGCIIIVPSKAYSEPIKWSEVVGLVSSTASTAAVVISVLNLTK